MRFLCTGTALRVKQKVCIINSTQLYSSSSVRFLCTNHKQDSGNKTVQWRTGQHTDCEQRYRILHPAVDQRRAVPSSLSLRPNAIGEEGRL